MAFVKLGALFVVVAATALPFASCGGIDFMGHELLRNVQPDDAKQLTEGALDRAMDAAAEAGDAPLRFDSRQRSSKKKETEPLFTGGDRWLHWLFVAIAALGVVGLFLKDGQPLAAAFGVLGAGGVVVFLLRFAARIEDGIPKGMPLAGLRWEIGAWLALAGFGAMVLGGLGIVRLARSGTVPP